ncbi:MAG: DUF6206 family protein [Anaerolineae bacterium]|jgi:hypothetical protein
MSLSPAQISLLEEFEQGLDPRWPERSRVPARVLGYGEISTVFAIQAEGLEDLAFKRLPLFYNDDEIKAYQVAYAEYNRLLQEEIGLRLPAFGYCSLANQTGRPIFYIVQRQLPAASIGNQAMHLLPRDRIMLLVRCILQELRLVWDFNRRQDQLRIGLDGQISNWSIEGFDSQHPYVDDDTSLTYLDTSTPLFRIAGEEQMDPELFLRSAPSFLVWILRLLFVQDVVDRYYDFRRVVVDLVANFYKEQRPELIPELVDAANSFFAEEAADLGLEPIDEKQVRAYYREDALIWTLYLSMRRLDRWLHTTLLRREYPYILPGKTKR